MFRRRQPGGNTLLPESALATLAMFGRNHCNGLDPDPSATATTLYVPGITAAERQPEQLMREIAAAGFVRGGWALVGGVRLLMELDLVTTFRVHPEFLALLDASLDFLQSEEVSSGVLRPFEIDRWIETHGSMRTFIGHDLAEVPATGDEPVVEDLPMGERRRMAQLFPRPDSNVIYAEHRGVGVFWVMTQAPKSDDDPERVMWDWFSAPSLVALLRELGERMVTPPYWAHEDLLPYFPWQPPKQKG